MDYKYVRSLVHMQDARRLETTETTDLALSKQLTKLLRDYVNKNYFMNATNPRILQLVLMLLNPESSRSNLVSIEGRQSIVEDSDSITMIGTLNRVRPIIAGQSRQELGMKYSGFGSHLRFPFLGSVSSEAMENELEDDYNFGQKAVGKFKPEHLDLTVSRNQIHTTRSSDLIIYKTITASFMAGIMQYQSELPAAYEFGINTRSIRMAMLRSVTVFVMLSTDKYYMIVKVWSNRTKKMLFRHTILAQKSDGGISGIVSIQRQSKASISLLCIADSHDYRLLTIDMRTRRVECLTLADRQTFSPVVVGMAVYGFDDFEKICVYRVDRNGAAVERVREVALSGIGPVCDLIGIQYKGKDLLVVFNFFDMAIMIIDGSTGKTTKCQVSDDTPKETFCRTIKSQVSYDKKSQTIVCAIKQSIWRLDISNALTTNFAL